ncbi:MAG: hypothetical protein ACYC5O_20540 [Anaerolineae bacterium]
MPWLVVRAILALSLLVSLAVMALAFWSLGFGDPVAWAVVAAALAVITSVISSWAAQRALELQQNAQKPYPYPSVDMTSRYGIVQLRVTNYGGGAAYDITINWNKPLLNSRGESVRFTDQEGAPDIPILMPNESISILIDGSWQLFQTYQGMDYTGTIAFRNASKRASRHDFYLSIEKYRKTLCFTEEEVKTHHDLQRIPEELGALRAELRRIRDLMEP